MIHYTVAKGDSLWQIAQAYNITLDALLAANPQISDANLIMAGSVINIPEMWEPPTCHHHGHHGCPGHHHWHEYHGAAPSEQGPAFPLCGENGARPCIYQAQQGETLESIAKKFMIPISQIIYHNLRYGKREPLEAGSRIIIPDGAPSDRELPPSYK